MRCYTMTAKVVACVVSLLGLSSAAIGQDKTPATKPAATNPPAPTPPAPARPIPLMQAVALSRWALIAYEQAKETGQFEVLYALGHKDFQKSTTVAKLKDAFAPYARIKMNDLLIIPPEFSANPEVQPNGVLRLQGFFLSYPTRERFIVDYAPENDEWRLLNISVGYDDLRPAAPPATAPAAKKN